MEKYSRMLVALDLSKKDNQLLDFSGFLTDFFGIEKVYFVHIVPNLEIPHTDTGLFYKAYAPDHPVDEKIKQHLEQQITDHYWHSGVVDSEIEVIEGRPYHKLIHWLDVKQIDLLVVGKKNVSEGSGITPQRVARKAKTAIFFAGESTFAAPDTILVPMNFSEPSIGALQLALKLKKKDPKTTIKAINVVCPAGVSPEIGLSYPNLVSMLQEKSTEAYQELIQNEAIDSTLFEFHIEVCKDINVARCLSEYAENENVNLIITGATGHSNLNSFLFGSVTESLVQRATKASILVVR